MKKVGKVRWVKAERTSRVCGSSSKKLFCSPLSPSEPSYSFVSYAWIKPFQFNVGPPLSLAASSVFKTDFSEENPVILYVHRCASRSEESTRMGDYFVDGFCSSLLESAACSTFLPAEPQTTENNG